MTQLQTMSNQELNRKLAELMGWKAGGDPNKRHEFVWWIDDNRFRIPENWNPCTDPAASLEVQAKAIKFQNVTYSNALLSLVDPEEVIEIGFGDGRMDHVGYTIDGTASMLLATLRQRAEAAYITLSQVNER